MSDFEDDIYAFDDLFETWKIANPDGTFGEFSAARIAESLKKGRAHTSLGPLLKDADDWWKAGAGSYTSLKRHHLIRNTDKVIDYGCGSLRIGAHFIKKHYNSLYFGLDVTDDFIKYGLKLLGDDLKARKLPKTGTIKADMDRAVEFEADVIFSANVAGQIHPNDTDEYFTNLKRLAGKKHSCIIIHTPISEFPMRMKRSGWARNIEFFDSNMRPFIRIATTQKKSQHVRGITIPSYLMTYQMPL